MTAVNHDAVANVALAERFSVCQHVLRLGDLRLDVEAAVAAGPRAFSVNASDYGGVSPASGPLILADAGLAVSSYIDPAVMRLGPDEPDFDAIDRAFVEAAALDAPCFLFIAGSIGRRAVDDADAHLVDALGRIAERTAGSGVRPMLEPLHPIARDLSYMHTLRHALSITRQVAGTGIVVDTGAVWWERDLITDFAAAIDSILAVQITDVSAEGMLDRVYGRIACSGTGAVPVAELMHAFVAAGYRGWFEHEVLMKASAAERVDLVSSDRRWFASQFDNAGGDAVRT